MELKRIIDIMLAGRREGVDILHLMGGEPTEHEYFVEIISLAKTLGYRTHIITNGSLFSDFCFACASLPHIDELCFSVHGASSKSHDCHTKRPGSFREIEKAVGFCGRSYSGRLLMNVTVTSLNLGELPAMVEWGASRGVYGIRFLNIVPQGVEPGRYLKITARLKEISVIIPQLADSASRHNIVLRFGGLPLCVMAESRFFAYEFWEEEMRPRAEIQQIGVLWSKEVNKASDDFSGYAYIDMGRIKAGVCGKCLMRDYCGGVFPAYIENFGETELRPYTDCI